MRRKKKKLPDFISVTGFAKILGTIEIILGIFIASRRFSPRVSAIGSMGAMFMFFLTLTFLFTTPGIWQPGYGFPFLSPMPGQFLAKDILFFGAATYTAGEAASAANLMSKTYGRSVYA